MLFKGWILGIEYNSWGSYKKAWNRAVMEGKLFDKKGRRVTKIYE